MTYKLVAVLAAISSALLMSLTPAAATTPATADAPWSGFRLPGNHTAGGGWIGGRTIAGQVVYRIDPARAQARSASFGSASAQSAVAGSGARPASAAATARAAWIVSKYGSYRYAIQNAAVEVALDDLLVGGRWALGGAVTTQRLAATGQAASVRRFAVAMLRDAARFAGPYAVDVQAEPAAAGDPIKVSIRVTAIATRAPVADLPVTVTSPGQVAATGIRTDASGSVRAALPGTTAGPHQISVQVSRVPQTQLLVRNPTTKGASRVVVAGHKGVLTAQTTAAVLAQPQVSLTTTTPQVSVDQPATGQLTVIGGYPSTRTATAALYGPFSSPGAASCDPAKVAGSKSVIVATDGTYPLPQLPVPSYGYYVWGATLAADPYNQRATTCAGTVLARVQPVVRAVPTGASYRSGAYVHGLISATDLPNGYSADATLRLYGPFSTAASAGCDSSKLVRTQTVAVTSTGAAQGQDLQVTRLGYYVWAVSLPASAFSLTASSDCTATAATFKVTW